MEKVVMQYHDRVITTSMKVAEFFGKEHEEVLKDIKELKCSNEFRDLNFEESSYKTTKKSMPIYFITKDGFTMLVMGYNNERAVGFKEAFISAFNRMERALRQLKSPSLIPVYQQRILSEPTKSCPANRWCVFDQAGEVMLLIEKWVGSVNQFDLADGSIGQHWSKFREDRNWRKTVSQYWHEFNDIRGKQLSNCYEYTELEHFKVWLKNVYIPTLLYPYLHSKYKKDKSMLPRVEAMKPKLIGAAR
jgi:Rha family phage regulatory protein